MKVLSLLILALLSCAAGAAGLRPGARLTARVTTGAGLAPDTLVMGATWTNPVDDGRGAPDSLRLIYEGIIDVTTYTFRPPFPNAHTHRQIIPAAAYVASGSATYDVLVRMQTWRRGAFVQVLSAPVPIALIAGPPPPVTGLNLTAIKRP